MNPEKLPGRAIGLRALAVSAGETCGRAGASFGRRGVPWQTARQGAAGASSVSQRGLSDRPVRLPTPRPQSLRRCRTGSPKNHDLGALRRAQARRPGPSTLGRRLVHATLEFLKVATTVNSVLRASSTLSGELARCVGPFGLHVGTFSRCRGARRSPTLGCGCSPGDVTGQDEWESQEPEKKLSLLNVEGHMGIAFMHRSRRQSHISRSRTPWSRASGSPRF